MTTSDSPRSSWPMIERCSRAQWQGYGPALRDYVAASWRAADSNPALPRASDMGRAPEATLSCSMALWTARIGGGFAIALKWEV